MAFELKRNDLRPRFRVQLTQTNPALPTEQIPVDLTDAASIDFKMGDGTTTVEGPASFVDRTEGIVEYVWTAGDTDTAGDFNCEFEVMWGSEPQTFPSAGYFTVRINPDLG